MLLGTVTWQNVSQCYSAMLLSKVPRNATWHSYLAKLSAKPLSKAQNKVLSITLLSNYFTCQVWGKTVLIFWELTLARQMLVKMERLRGIKRIGRPELL